MCVRRLTTSVLVAALQPRDALIMETLPLPPLLLRLPLFREASGTIADDS